MTDTPRDEVQAVGREDLVASEGPEDFVRVCILVAVGSAAACAVATLHCRPPQAPILTWGTLLARSLEYLAVTAIAGTLGVAGAWMALASRPRVRRRQLVMHALMGWLFLPGIVLLDRSWPVWALPVIAVATAGLAVSLQLLAPREIHELPPLPEPEFASFYGLERTGFRPGRALTIALCAEGALVFAVREDLVFAGCLLGAGIFLLLFHWSREVRTTLRSGQRKALGGSTGATAWLVCILVLMPWLARYAAGAPVVVRAAAVAPRAQTHYSSVVLWPPKPVVTALYFPSPNAIHAAVRMTKPMEIPFDGPYWYFEDPATDPGPTAHVASGLPTDEGINPYSAGGGPLRMEGVEKLSQPIDYGCCASLDVAVTDVDTESGPIHLGVLLTDTTSRDDEGVLLGFASVAGSERLVPQARGAQLTASVHFTLPPSRKMRRFNEITVMVVPTLDFSRGSKVAIEGFTLQPK
ncbi:MAG TPA: hypothetical protein VME68_11245 [Acidobacteriaceae bacterium]|nr:hypothetical protein [Acidobacteriaceae bacterium]